MRSGLLALAIAVLPGTVAMAADTLIVCPQSLRGALAPWESHRREQGHSLRVIAPPRSSNELRKTVAAAAARDASLQYVVLVGDVDLVPTSYANAKINVQWGSESTIATDQLYADVNGDTVPDVAVGRIPARTPEELHAVVRKLLRYEHSANGDWQLRLDVVAGVGGFGVVTDALIEASARSVFQQVVPENYSVRRLKADPDATCDQISAGSLAWIYLGHGLPTQLDLTATARGPRPILAVTDVPRLRCGSNSPLAVLIACYAGAIDAENNSLAEELVLHQQGPVAAIAATRVTMPYGNSVFGCELLRAAFRESPGTLGDIWLRADRETLSSAHVGDSLRTSLDAVARGVSPPPADLAAERREHVLLYQLLGDPLLRINFSQSRLLSTPRVAETPVELRSR